MVSTTTKMVKLLVPACMAALIAASADAGVKYWDNPNFKSFDVGDYVQDGLVLHYDGIRNAGPNAAHDHNATTWVNLGTGGADYDMAKKGSPTSSYWTDSGFYFEGKTWFVTPNQVSLGTAYETEILVDAAYAKQVSIGYILFTSTAYPRKDDSGWRFGSIGIRKNGATFNQTIDGTTYNATLCLNTDGSPSAGTVKRPVLLDPTFEYMTAVANETYTCIFTGLDEPTGAPGRSGLASGKTILTGNSLYFFLGGHNNNDSSETTTAETLIGMIRSFRHYSAPISREQRAWNRVVDEARYFHRRGALPVTNVVVAVTGINGIEDDHFALDGDGYTFTAPTSRTIEGKRYSLDGYTLETWNGSSWVSDGAGTHAGNSAAISDTTGKVRLTWQYSRPAGEGQLAHYDVSDYVQNGLVVHFDGIRNQGVSSPHSNDATTWINLGSGGSANNATNTLGTSGGYWTDDGYRFGGYGTKFVGETAHTWHTDHTAQTLVDAAYADNKASGDGNYVFSSSWNKGALVVRGGDSTKTVWFHTQGLAHNAMPCVANQDLERFTYATAIHNGTAGTACVFTGTEPPTSGEITAGFLSYESSMAEYTSKTAIGGWGGNVAQYLVGKVKNFRYYSRVLTNDELAQNRKVDEYRFFGRYVVTNVLVQSTYSYLDGYEKAGPYEVEGSYTFTAPETMTAPNGITYACAGYTVETHDGIGWAALTSGTGNSYLYNASAGTVRLTWKWKATSGLRTAEDYSIDDLSPAGLALHYDGIFNQGVGVARSTTSTKWINLGLEGAAYDLTLNKGSDNSTWGDYGYFFAGKSRFSQSVTRRWGPTLTVQVLIDAKRDDLQHASSANYIFGTAWNACSLTWYKSEGRGLEFHTQSKPSGSTHYGPYCPGTAFDFANITLDATAKQASIFTGTTVPTDPSVAGCTAYDAVASNVNGFNLGGWGGGTSQYLVGTVKNLRYYDRVLTEEELVRNRNVDAVRYFGELGVTNVFVVAGGEGAVQTEVGAYKVEGSWTFTATKTVNRKGDVVDVARYSVEELVDGEWANKQTCNGNSYTYTEGTDPTTVRLTWLPEPLGMMVIVK